MSVNITVSTLGLPGQNGSDATVEVSERLLIQDDWISSTFLGQLGWTNLAVSGGTTSLVTAESNHQGILSLSTGSSSSSGYSTVYLGTNTIYLGNGTLDLEFLIRIPTLSAAGERYSVRIGLGDSNNADHSNGIWFEYSEATSANWLLCVNNASSASKTTSSTAVGENTWIKLKISINAAASLITYYVNGTSIGTKTTGFSTSGFGPRMHIVKSVGTAARTIQFDYFLMDYILTTSR